VQLMETYLNFSTADIVFFGGDLIAGPDQDD
jgi:hypothetical protein